MSDARRPNSHQRRAEKLAVEVADLRAENAALKAKGDALARALETQLETHDQGHSPCACIESRAALSAWEKATGAVDPQQEKQP